MSIETYSETTLHKVYDALAAAGVVGLVATDVVNQLQNRGILFRENIENTDEERHARVSVILETHLAPTCISCGEKILPGEGVVNTIHGKYHERPKPCLDGRLF